MANFWLLWLLSYAVTAGLSYRYLYKSRRLIGYHFGMNLAMLASGVIGLAVGVLLGAQFPALFAEMTIVSTVVAVAVGMWFGALVDYQTMLTGVTGGVMSGLMGPMIGVMANHADSLLLFCSALVYLCFGLLCYSKRS